MTTMVYKIATKQEWELAKAAGVFKGAEVDLADGYIHLSSADQVRQTAALHFAGKTDLLLIAMTAEALEPRLIWEPSRGGALFPHLYAPIQTNSVHSVRDLPLGPDGKHEFPPEIPA